MLLVGEVSEKSETAEDGFVKGSGEMKDEECEDEATAVEPEIIAQEEAPCSMVSGGVVECRSFPVSIIDMQLVSVAMVVSFSIRSGGEE